MFKLTLYVAGEKARNFLLIHLLKRALVTARYVNRRNITPDGHKGEGNHTPREILINHDNYTH